MSNRAIGLFTFIAIGLAGWVISRHTVAQTANPKNTAAVVALMKERCLALKSRAEIVEALVQRGIGSQIDGLNARDDWMCCEVELADSVKDRRALLESRVENLKRAEAYYSALKMKGAGTEADILWASAKRLQAQIDLERVEIAN